MILTVYVNTLAVAWNLYDVSSPNKSKSVMDEIIM